MDLTVLKVFYYKVFICLLLPVCRIRKLIKKLKMKQLKIAALTMTVNFFILTYLLYWNWNTLSRKTPSPEPIVKPTTTEVFGTVMRHIPLNVVYPDQSKHFPNESYEFENYKPAYWIDTQGCKIPLEMIDYKKHSHKKNKYTTCGKRAVFMKKVDRDKVQALIKPKLMKTYLRKSAIFDCCYRFINRSSQPIYENRRIKYTKCAKFENNAIIKLETDFINVNCFDYDKRNVSHIIYNDVYAFTKGITTKPSQGDCRVKYNVLMIGMDSMSLPRFAQELSRTVHYFEDNFWLGYRGYHKIETNTFPNLMAVLTGKDLKEILEKCTDKMDACHDLLVWNKFKEAGYVTAFGEDNLNLPDTFSNEYAFKVPPTDHYMKPFFIGRETELYNNSLVCAGKISSGQQLLNYALDFTNTYRSDQFFGLYWMNSFSHNDKYKPHDADGIMENFFNQLGYTGILKNTFVIVLSDHGIRFGEHRLKVESYYDERMPFLFILAPEKFKGRHPIEFKAMAENQFRLVTPYDLYQTLNDINDISACRNSTTEKLEACPKCHSVFETVSANRTCQDVAIHDKWCSCHKLFSLPVQDTEGEKSVQIAVTHIKQMVNSMKTRRCWRCMALSLKKIIRIHFYYSNDKARLYYVVAFTMTPGNVSYEATVLLKDGKREVVGPVSRISPYRGGKGPCTMQRKDRLFCLCEKIYNC